LNFHLSIQVYSVLFFLIWSSFFFILLHLFFFQFNHKNKKKYYYPIIFLISISILIVLIFFIILCNLFIYFNFIIRHLICDLSMYDKKLALLFCNFFSIRLSTSHNVGYKFYGFTMLARPLLPKLHFYQTILGWLKMVCFVSIFLSRSILPKVNFYPSYGVLFFFKKKSHCQKNLTRVVCFSYFFEMHLQRSTSQITSCFYLIL
jgi:hypothetical protein